MENFENYSLHPLSDSELREIQGGINARDVRFFLVGMGCALIGPPVSTAFQIGIVVGSL